MIQLPTQEELLEFVLQSNLIEEEPSDQAHPLFQSHLEACELVIEVIAAGLCHTPSKSTKSCWLPNRISVQGSTGHHMTPLGSSHTLVKSL